MWMKHWNRFFSFACVLFGCLFFGSPLSAETNRIGQGYYLYEIPPTNEGRRSDGKPLPVSFETGLLTDGSEIEPGKSARWGAGSQMVSGGLTILFDLKVDRILEDIIVLPGPGFMNWHGMAGAAISYRADADPFYCVSGYQLLWPDGKERALHFPMKNVKARFIQLRISRVPLDKLNLKEVIFLATDSRNPSGGPDEQILKTEIRREPRFLDRYGQYLYEEWAGKIKSDDQLVREAQAEDRILQNQLLVPDPEKFDIYGGIKKGPSFPATGFFSLKKIDGMWWLITPEGHRFFLIGIDGADGTLLGPVPIYQKGTSRIREIFEEIPDPLKYPEAYTHPPASALNFVEANLKRKYGHDYKDKWCVIQKKRLLDWGFNGSARWYRNNPKAKPLEMPHTETLWLWKTWGKTDLGRIGSYGGGGAIDPFDPRFKSDLEADQKDWLIKNKNNPWIIGYVFENENGWDYDTIDLVMDKPAPCPARDALAKFFYDRYKGGKAFSKTNLSKKDKSDFLRLASRTYYKTIREILNRYDGNHLFLGSALSHLGCEEWATGGIEFLDALTFNSYSDDPKLHAVYDKYEKPRILTEFGLSVFARGLGGWTFCPDHRTRGLKYRQMVESFAANPYVVGFGWFKMGDDLADIGGYSGYGENFNLGLRNICDQPYWKAIENIRIANRNIYDIRTCPTASDRQIPGKGIPNKVGN